MTKLYGSKIHGDVAAAKAATIAVLKTWTPECRWKAFDEECGKRCGDDMHVELLMAAAPPEEAKRIRKERLARNEASVKKGEPIVAKVRTLLKHANAIRSQPRGATATCLQRMRDDGETITKLDKEIEAALADIPVGLASLKATIVLARTCLDCSDDRTLCDDMNEDMKVSEEVMAAYRTTNEADAKALGR
ncbi:MAG: hypothetical protein HOW73_00765 [Polyangiaceae bacterium]|nr:hypothetical protein [Polyangiaceae bacterium]